MVSWSMPSWAMACIFFHPAASKMTEGREGSSRAASAGPLQCSVTFCLQKRRVVYPHRTDNSGVDQCSKIVLFHPRGRGPHHDAEPVVLPTPLGRSRVDLPHAPRLVPSMSGACEKCCCSACRRCPSRRRSKHPDRWMRVALNGCGVRRGRPSGRDEALKTGFESG
jgi:hypothetical protein